MFIGVDVQRECEDASSTTMHNNMVVNEEVNLTVGDNDVMSSSCMMLIMRCSEVHLYCQQFEQT